MDMTWMAVTFAVTLERSIFHHSHAMGGDHPPNPPRYEPDGSGRDTYIRRDPHTVYGKTLYTEVKQIPTRFGDAGSATSHSKHTGYCGYTLGGRDPSSAEYDEGFGGRVGGEGGGGLKVVQARYLPPSRT